MKRIKIQYLMLLMAALLLSPGLHAQKDLQIGKIFDQYRKKEGVVMVELTNAVLGDYKLSFFKSITIKNIPAASRQIRECLAKDEAGARKIKQVVTNGVPTSIFLQLPKKNNDNRLILFNESNQSGNTITLIYIETRYETEDVLKLLLQKK